ncbi:hypothetical protein [Allokutzneria albata]|uniref:Peptidase inhibitor family I36 n=1 Tax=Allokutzneria albata TaxID=211114 RepID=A0A1H0AM16_ALLAB|nr:hypothetical protein [Allokutzneria albata]SDN34612.1 hypothetical protein SAMN04489726_6167 [Allokutzneria albata]
MRKQATVLGLTTALAAIALATPATASAAAGFEGCDTYTNGTVCARVNATSVEVRYQKTGGSTANTTFGYRYGNLYYTGPTVSIAVGKTVTKKMPLTRKPGTILQGIVASAGTEISHGLKTMYIRT